MKSDVAFASLLKIRFGVCNEDYLDSFQNRIEGSGWFRSIVVLIWCFSWVRSAVAWAVMVKILLLTVISGAKALN